MLLSVSNELIVMRFYRNILQLFTAIISLHLLFSSLCLAEVSQPDSYVIVEVILPNGDPAVGLKFHSQIWLPDSDRSLFVEGVTDEEGCFSIPEEGDWYLNDFYGVFTWIHTKELGYNFYTYLADHQPAVKKVIFQLRKNESKLMFQLSKPDGSPAEDVEIMLNKAIDFECSIGARLFKFSQDSGVWNVKSDEQGLVVFEGLPTARYEVNHSSKDYAAIPSIVDRNYGYQTGDVHSLDLIQSSEISGRLIGLDGKGIVGQKVYALGLKIPGLDAEAATTLTDKNGYYALHNLRAQDYEVGVILDRTQALSSAAPLSVVKDLKLGEKRARHDIQLVHGVTVSCKLIDRENNSELDLNCYSIGVSASKSKSYLDSYKLYKSGDLYTAQLPAGDYSFRIIGGLKGYNRATLTEVNAVLREGVAEELVFEISPVEVDESRMVRGAAVDEDGQFVEGVGVYQFVHGRSIEPAKATTGAKGEFAMELVSDDKGKRAVFASDGKSLSALLDLSEGGASVIKFEPKQLISVNGRIVDSLGLPIQNLGLRYAPYSYDLNLRELDTIFTTVTDADGRFEFPHVWSGIPFIIAPVARNSVFVREPVEFTVNVGGSSDIGSISYLRRNKSIRGRVVNADGEPVGAAILAGSENQPYVDALTDEDGSFLLEGLVSGEAELKVYEYKYGSMRRVLTETHQAGAQNINLVYDLAEPTLSLSGKIVSADGAPLVGAIVEPVWGQPDGIRAVTDAQGDFELQGLFPDWFSIQVRPAITGSCQQKFRVKAGNQGETIRMASDERAKKVENMWAEFDRPLNLVGQELVGSEAPAIEISHWYSDTKLEAKVEGKIRVINFWGIGCRPCIKNIPNLEKFWQVNQGRGLELLMIEVGAPHAEVKEFFSRKLYMPAMPMAGMEDGDIAILNYIAYGRPTYVVVDENNIIQHWSIGDWAKAEEKALQLLENLERRN